MARILFGTTSYSRALTVRNSRCTATLAPSFRSKATLAPGLHVDNYPKEQIESRWRRRPSPLAALPTNVLLRSLLINTISSKPFLLSPSLAVLSALCKPGRSWLFNVDRNPFLHAILKRTFYRQFCAGENTAETKATLRQLKDMGFRGTMLTYAKETVFNHRTKTSHGLGIPESEGKSQLCENIEAWRDGTLKTVEMLGEGDQLAVKLTGAGPMATERFAAGELPPPQMMKALHEICAACAARKANIIIDAESQHFQTGIFLVGLDLMRAYNTAGHAVIYHTYQGYLKSTAATLAKHLALAADENFTLGLKLVRGAYMASDPRSLIHNTKEDTDAAYNAIAQGALTQSIGAFGASRPFPSVNLMLATHNKASALTAHELHTQRVKAGLPTVPVKFAQLQGMSDDVSFGLLALKDAGHGAPEVYKCSTWGSLGECLAYLTRRAAENRDAASRTAGEVRALRKELGTRVRGWFSWA